jgi:Chaperone of endosialidase
MKKSFLSLLLCSSLFLTTKSFAQNVAINEDGSAANPNAILDVKSFTKGILIPRVSTTGRLAIPNTKGLLVYDSTAGSFFFNTGGGWQNMTSTASTSESWSINGNRLVTTPNSFLGTVDSTALIIKVNNQLSGRIDPTLTNTLWGYNTGGNQGGGNTAIGYSSMKNARGSDNTSVGFKALTNNFSGFDNTAIGSSSLTSDSSGYRNTAIGRSAMHSNGNGVQNTAIGAFSMFYNNSGTENTAIGESSLELNSIGNRNTAVGQAALLNNTTGSNNTAIGYHAGVDSGNLTNATAIGAFAIVRSSNKVRIGNSAVTVIEGQVPFTTPSDGRFKYQVREDVKGLDFIMQLRPVTYQFDVKGFDEQMMNAAEKSSTANEVIQASYREAAAIRRTGFIAQEVEKAANATGYDFSGIIKPKTEQDHYSLSYESFVVPLVKAVQEQQQLIEDLKKQVEELKHQVQGSK